MKQFPYIFWINISIRKNWFSLFWKSRGANFIEIQFLIFKINIGCSWGKNILKYYTDNCESLSLLKKSNEMNLKAPLSFQVGSYDGFIL